MTNREFFEKIVSSNANKTGADFVKEIIGKMEARNKKVDEEVDEN